MAFAGASPKASNRVLQPPRMDVEDPLSPPKENQGPHTNNFNHGGNYALPPADAADAAVALATKGGMSRMMGQTAIAQIGGAAKSTLEVRTAASFSPHHQVLGQCAADGEPSPLLSDDSISQHIDYEDLGGEGWVPEPLSPASPLLPGTTKDPRARAAASKASSVSVMAPAFSTNL